MEFVRGSDRIIADGVTNATAGTVRWRPFKSFWLSAMTVIAVVGAPLTFGFGELAIFLGMTAVTLCAGHSVGMHRRLIHQSFDCPQWLEYVLVYLGVLVGMAGPIGMMRQHDLRDWAQRQQDCHEYLRHGRGFWVDYFWQCHCDIDLAHPPKFEPEARIIDDKIYLGLEKTWMAQQAPVAAILFVFGGWSYVIWGVALRVFVGVTGHWLVGHFAHHNYGDPNRKMSWRVKGAVVQGLNVSIAGFVSMGESWHNNHHAFPGSAKIGILEGQPDPGWRFIKALEKIGLAQNIVTPETMPARAELVRVATPGTGWRICHVRKKIWRAAFG